MDTIVTLSCSEAVILRNTLFSLSLKIGSSRDYRNYRNYCSVAAKFLTQKIRTESQDQNIHISRDISTNIRQAIKKLRQEMNTANQPSNDDKQPFDRRGNGDRPPVAARSYRSK